MYITEIFNKEQLDEIGLAFVERAQVLGPTRYYEEIYWREGWFNLITELFPDDSERMLDYVEDPSTEVPPDDELGHVIFHAERSVFGVSVAEYKAKTRIVDFYIYVVIRHAMRTATEIIGGEVRGY